MKDKQYLAINLNDFHANQNGNAETNTQIKLISAGSLDKANEHMRKLYPNQAWAVIPKNYFDEHIVYKTV